jgi:hypothetical protein
MTAAYKTDTGSRDRALAGGRLVFELRSRPLQPPIALNVVGNGGEMNLEFGFLKPDPSHRVNTIAAFPGAEDFFNARPDRSQRRPLRKSLAVPPLALIAASTESAS